MTDQEENPDTSRALSLIHSDSNSSSFCSITVSQPKIRIKIPKLLAKAMQEKSNGYSASANKPDRTKAKKNKWGKVRSVFSCAFNSNKLPRTYSNVQRNVDANDHHQEGVAEGKILRRVESDVIGDHQPVAVLSDQSPLSKSYSIKKLLEIEDEEQKRPNKETRASKKQPRKADKSLNISLSFSRLFKKSTNCNFMRGKFNEIDTNSVGVGRIADIVIERQASTRSLSRLPSTGNTSDIVNLPRVPSRILTCRRNLKMSQSLTKIKSTRINEGKSSERKDRGEEELCKKRILMGEKCKPLSYSGTLEYDKDGVLLPDVIQR
ncbi:hypothetical protein P3X46_008569 [Hevea brasiliensis]|uniref:Calmodulin-binding domain-containing protein n=1 Tax=Hevea brasiliensis TaxID=3981 RepID=A0ABQ9MK45_HEVBR|nr:hypothetical protein P3X46_008569 [Hevea brasiliensis]